MSTRWARKAFLGIESPLDYAMALVREEKPAKGRQVQLTPRQQKKLERWMEARRKALGS